MMAENTKPQPGASNGEVDTRTEEVISAIESFASIVSLIETGVAQMRQMRDDTLAKIETAKNTAVNEAKATLAAEKADAIVAVKSERDAAISSIQSLLNGVDDQPSDEQDIRDPRHNSQ